MMMSQAPGSDTPPAPPPPYLLELSMATHHNSGPHTPSTDDEKRSMTQQDVVEVIPNPSSPVQYTRWQKFVSAVWDP